MSYSEYIVNDNDDPVWSTDPAVSVSCALPDLRYVMALALGVVVVSVMLGVWLVNRLRPW